MKDLFKLTTKQQRAFNKLKKALDDCKKANLFFYNNYGTLGVTDAAKINQYDDVPTDFVDQYYVNNLNEVKLPCNEWADDKHYFHLTD